MAKTELNVVRRKPVQIALAANRAMLAGRAIPYDVPAEIGPGLTEVMAPGCVADFLSNIRQELQLVIEHNPQTALGSRQAGTLRLFDRPDGLYFECDLPNTPQARQIQSEIAANPMLWGMSWHMVCAPGSYEEEPQYGGGMLRTIRRIELLAEISLTRTPYYGAAATPVIVQDPNQAALQAQYLELLALE